MTDLQETGETVAANRRMIRETQKEEAEKGKAHGRNKA